MTQRQDELLTNEDPRFFAIDKAGTGLGALATTELLNDGAEVSFGLPSGPALFLNIALAAHQRRMAVGLASRSGSVRLNRLAAWISGLPLVDHAAARSGWWKYIWSGVRPPSAECGRTAL